MKNKRTKIQQAVALILTALLTIPGLEAKEYHVSVSGNDSADGSVSKPLRTISAAARFAAPGDVITVHQGIYRERVDPPRGGESDAKRITYRSAPGEKVVITGAEVLKGWEQVGGDTWKATIPNKLFGGFNPFTDLIQGEWCTPTGRHTGAVYLNGDWMAEAANLGDVLKPAGGTPLFFAKVNGADAGDYLINFEAFTVGKQRIAADSFSAKSGELRPAPSSEGKNSVGYIRSGNWLKFDKVDFGPGSDHVEFRAASLTGGGDIELRLDKPDGKLLGICTVDNTGDWQKWASFTAKTTPVSGVKSLCLVFKPYKSQDAGTTVWAQFPGVNPDEANVEINVRQSVFYPSRPWVNYITVRGFTLRQAATPWAGAMSEQVGLIGTNWSKGWIIEDNDIGYSMCTGVTLGHYDLPRSEMPPATAEGYVQSIRLALDNGWSKEKVGGHIVRYNRISHCEKNGIHGSLGGCFSEIYGNDIHDISVCGWVRGADTAGIKFLGGIDVKIHGNHIYRCGDSCGIWLDWLAQGAQVTGNLMHDNIGNMGDMFCEMQHGPILVANNILLSQRSSLCFNSQGIAVVHNLLAGPLGHIRSDTRITPFNRAHSTEIAGMYAAASGDSGDHRFYNNLFVAPCDLHAFNDAMLPCFAAGNVFLKGTQPSKYDTGSLLKPGFDPCMTLTKKRDGWYLDLTLAKNWATEQSRQLVTTKLLGKAKVPHLPFENADGSPIRMDTDYFGKRRNVGNPFPGPFEIASDGKQTLKVWPNQ